MDVLTRIIVPEGARDVWLADALVTPVSNPSGGTAGSLHAGGTKLELNDSSDNAGGPSNAGFPYSSGRHQWEFDIERVFSGSGTVVCRVRNITDSTNLVTQTVNFDGPGRQTVLLEADITDADLYQPQVDDPTGSPIIFDVYSIKHGAPPYLLQNEQAHTDPQHGTVHKRDSSGNLVGVLATEGTVPLMVGPGLTAIFIIPLDAPKPGYTEPESVKGRTVTVTATGSPRYLS